MTRRVYITGLGPISGAGLDLETQWDAIAHGRSAVAGISAFDPSGFDSRIAAAIPEHFKVRDVAPKSYRKATKVMSRDVELAVAAAAGAVSDAGWVTKGTDAEAEPSCDPARVATHIGAGLIAADPHELAAALAEAADGAGGVDLPEWGRSGMSQLSPLWLLKYLPNMLACHVSIIHGARGPSNTITCQEASGGLSVGEAVRVIQRGAADASLCGGVESRLNPSGLLRQQMTGRLVVGGDDDPASAVRPFDENAAGTAIGEGGAILTLEAEDALTQRGGVGYARIAGGAAAQCVHPASRNREPDPAGRSLASAIRGALREAGIKPDAIDLVVPLGLGAPAWDAAEAAALRDAFGDRLGELPVLSTKAVLGNTGAGAGGLDLAVAALALRRQAVPATINREAPVPGFGVTHRELTPTPLRFALVCGVGLGGQCTATVLERAEQEGVER